MLKVLVSLFAGCLLLTISGCTETDENIFEISEMIYENCIIHHYPAGHVEARLDDAIENKCRRIEDNPSFWNRIKYSD